MPDPQALAADSDRMSLSCHHSRCSIDQQGELGSAGRGVDQGPFSLAVTRTK